MQAQKEFTLMQNLDYEAVTKMREIYFNPGKGETYIIMELHRGPTLLDFVVEKQKINEKLAASITK